MKKSFKYFILITLALMITASLVTVSLVNAQPVLIGATEQTRPYECNPTAVTATGTTGTFGAERDGNLATKVAYTGTSSAPGSVHLHNFSDTPPTPAFNIGWVDVKIKYMHPGLSDDVFSIAYNTDGHSLRYLSWLQTNVAGAAAKFDMNGVPAVRPWSNISTTSGGAWTWTDVKNFRVRINIVRGGDATWDSTVELYEVWLTIYEAPPPATSTAMSVMPPSNWTLGHYGVLGLQPGKFFFVDVYANGLTSPPGLWGYQATIAYDESIVEAKEWFSYWPFITPGTVGGGWIGIGNVSVLYGTFAGDLTGFTGTATPLCRIYFEVIAGGETPLDLIDDKSLTPPLISELKPAGAGGYVPPLYDGWFGGPHYLSAQPPVLIDLANPVTTNWHEEYPDWSKTWHLTSWSDENPDGVLGYSDQIDMTNETGWVYWFHVEEVTITIHWTLKEGEGGPLTEDIGAAEPEVPTHDPPSGSPVGSFWHMIYPDYCRTIEITSWEDSDTSGDFSPSDQFDFTYLPFDTLLAGPAPPAGAPLSTPGSTILYYDWDYSSTPTVGDGFWDDIDGDFAYTPAYMYYGLDVHLVGVEPAFWMYGSSLPPTVKYYDTNTNGLWDVGEPAIDDLDDSDTYEPQVTEWAHLDAVSTDILVSMKPIPPEQGVFEFPFGVNLLMLLVPIIPLTYLWRLRKKVRKQ